MDYSDSERAIDRERMAVVAQQLLTGPRRERHLCHVILADDWSATAPRCDQTATTYLCRDDYRSGIITGDTFRPSEGCTRVCDGHRDQIARQPGFRWSRPLSGEES